LAESNGHLMTSYDLRGVSRPSANSAATKTVIDAFFNQDGRFLDFDGGYGVFTRWMRDVGYDFWHSDAHCSNLFAQGFEADLSGACRYELVTSFEVFEHLSDPTEKVDLLFKLTDSIFLRPSYCRNLPRQSIAGGTLALNMASIFLLHTQVSKSSGTGIGTTYVASGSNFHLLTRKHISERWFRLAVRPRLSKVMYLLRRRSSLQPRDFQAAMDRAKKGPTQRP